MSSEASNHVLSLPALPYAYNALEPIISEKIMVLHHQKHHQTYTTKANEALAKLYADEKTRALATSGIENLVSHLETVPEAVRGVIRNHGGGFINHALFWRVMRPVTRDGNGALVPSVPSSSSSLAARINQVFGSLEQFQKQFNAQALGLFGSGWVWLYVDGVDGSLVLSTSLNQDSPLNAGKNHKLIFALDVWEHAYYLDYQNRRDEYVNQFWFIVNWDVIEKLYDEAVKNAKL